LALILLIEKCKKKDEAYWNCFINFGLDSLLRWLFVWERDWAQDKRLAGLCSLIAEKLIAK